MMDKEDTINIYSPLGRTESTWVANWLKEIKGKTVDGGWMRVYQLSIDQIAKQFHVPIDEVISAARGKQRR